MSNGYGFGNDGGFGQLAGSILASRRRGQKKDFKRAILASAIFNTFNNLSINNKQRMVDGINDIKDNFSDLVLDAQATFTENKDERQLYKMYQNEDTRDKALLTKAIDYFNTANYNEFGPDAYNTIAKQKKSEAGLQALNEEIELLKSNAKNYFEGITDRSITSANVVEYLAPIKAAYKAAIREAKNDPRKKSLIRKIFLDMFGRDEDGNPRFGLIYQDELKDERERLAAAAGITGQLVTPDVTLITDKNKAELEEIETQETIVPVREETTEDQNIKTKKKVNNKYGILTEEDSTPVSSHTTVFNNAIADETQKNKESGLDTNKFMFEGKERTVRQIYRELGRKENGRQLQIAFAESVLTYSKLQQEAFELQNTDKRVRLPQTFVISGIEAAVNDYNTQQGFIIDTKDIDTKSPLSFDVNETVKIKIGENVSETKLGALQLTFNEIENKDEALALLQSIKDALSDTHKVFVDNIENRYLQKFPEETIKELNSFFQYERKFRKNPLSLPNR
jgi:hypothetical protein